MKKMLVIEAGTGRLRRLCRPSRGCGDHDYPIYLPDRKGEKPDIRAGIKLGVDDYLTKPVAKPDLLAAIRSRLERMSAA